MLETVHGGDSQAAASRGFSASKLIAASRPVALTNLDHQVQSVRLKPVKQRPDPLDALLKAG